MPPKSAFVLSDCPAAAALIEETPVRVTYRDTDQMGHVYYANYLVWFEMGRTEWLRSRGRRYDDLERAGFYLPVKEAWCEYQQPALYDQMVRIVTWVAEVRRASLRFGYEIHDAEAGGRGRLARGWTLHAFVDRERRIVAPPPDVAELLRSGLPPIVA